MSKSESVVEDLRRRLEKMKEEAQPGLVVTYDMAKFFSETIEFTLKNIDVE